MIYSSPKIFHFLIKITPIINVSVVNAPSLYSIRTETSEFFRAFCENLGMEAKVVIENVQEKYIQINLPFCIILSTNFMFRLIQSPSPLNRNKIYVGGTDPLKFSVDEYHKWTEVQYTFTTCRDMKICQSFLQIYSFMDDLEKRYRNLCKVVEIGKTYEGRPMKLLKVTYWKNTANLKQSFHFDNSDIKRSIKFEEKRHLD